MLSRRGSSEAIEGAQESDNNLDEADYHIAFQLRPGIGYVVEDSPNDFAQVTIQNNDKDIVNPELSIERTQSSVIEGEEAILHSYIK